MGRRSPCCSKQGTNRGAWTAHEDKILSDYIKIHGVGRWRNLPIKAGLNRCGKSCRLRWLNYLRPDIKRGNISLDEEDLIIRLHRLLGNRWSLIAGRLPGRTDNEIKNYWNTNLSKKVHLKMINSTNSTSSINRKLLMNYKQSKEKTHDHHQAPAQPVLVVPELERAKATRCTEVFLLDSEHRKVDNGSPSTMEGKAMQIETELSDGSSSENFIVDDLGVGELGLSEFFNANFHQHCEILNDEDGDKNNNNNNKNEDGYNNNNNKNDELLPSSDNHPVLPLMLFHDDNEMVEDWSTVQGGCTQLDASSDLQALATFLDLEADWLGE